jgi:hypothetical protein
MESINIRCENFKQKLISDINECGLPISSAFYICQLVFTDLEKTYYATLNEEAQEVKEMEDIESDGIKE